MHISQTVRESCIGITLELSNQELLVLAEENSKLLNEIDKVKDYDLKKDTVRVPISVLKNITTFIRKYTQDVISLDEAAKELFSTPEEEEIEKQSKARKAYVVDPSTMM